MTLLARTYGVPRPNETPIFHTSFGKANLIQMNLQPNVEVGPVPHHADVQASQQAPSASHSLATPFVVP